MFSKIFAPAGNRYVGFGLVPKSLTAGAVSVTSWYLGATCIGSDSYNVTSPIKAVDS